MNIRRNDIVIPVKGKDAGAGKTGKVLQVLPGKNRALVEGINLVKRHMRKTQDNPKGGIVEKEAPMAIPNLRMYCPHCKKGVRVKRMAEAGKPVRKCRKCGHAFDAA